jgi:DNA damage-binding protein 1
MFVTQRLLCVLEHQMEYTYLVSSHKSSAVRLAISCSFTSPTAKNLVIAKSNRIEVYSLGEDGLILNLETSINGTITAIDFYRPGNSDLDQIFVLTEKKYFCIFSYDATTKTLITRAKGDLGDRVGKPVENGHRILIDPGRRVIGLLLYEGLMKVIYHNNPPLFIFTNTFQGHSN